MADVAAQEGAEDVDNMKWRAYQDEWVAWDPQKYPMAIEENPLGVRKVDRVAAALLEAAGVTVARQSGSDPMLPGGDTQWENFHHYTSFICGEIDAQAFADHVQHDGGEHKLPDLDDIEGVVVTLKGARMLE